MYLQKNWQNMEKRIGFLHHHKSKKLKIFKEIIFFIKSSNANNSIMSTIVSHKRLYRFFYMVDVARIFIYLVK